VQNVAGRTSQVHQAEAALRLERRQSDEQIRQTGSTLASLQAQETTAVADLEKASPTVFSIVAMTAATMPFRRTL
jgi:hypothetical protein